MRSVTKKDNLWGKSPSETQMELRARDRNADMVTTRPLPDMASLGIPSCFLRALHKMLAEHASDARVHWRRHMTKQVDTL